MITDENERKQNNETTQELSIHLKPKSSNYSMNNPAPRQLPRNLRIYTLTALISLMLAATGSGKSTHVMTNATGHQINAVIEGDHSIASLPGQGTISSPHGKITVEPSRVKFNDASWTTIPEAVPMEVKISKRTLWLAAGPVTVKQNVR
jgi:hypothetical protein